MSGAHIRTRIVQDGKRRYDVRYRRGGRGYKIEHGGTFKTLTEARARRDLIAGELAAGRDPRVTLAAVRDPAPALTIGNLAAAWLASRIDVTASTRRTYADHVKRITVELGHHDPRTLTASDIREWIGGLPLAAASVKNYVGTLRAILDTADLPANPARDRTVKLPRIERTEIAPPSGAQVERILSTVPKRWRLPLRLLEQTGMRIGEVESLLWQDVDLAGARLRIRQGKSAAARRWVALPDWLADAIAETCPPDDRDGDRRVFPGFTRGAARNAMARACKAAGIPHFHPHDLRHRYASVQLARGVPITNLSAQLGHTKRTLTLDTYAHVLLAEGDV